MQGLGFFRVCFGLRVVEGLWFVQGLRCLLGLTLLYCIHLRYRPVGDRPLSEKRGAPRAIGPFYRGLSDWDKGEVRKAYIFIDPYPIGVLSYLIDGYFADSYSIPATFRGRGR